MDLPISDHLDSIAIVSEGERVFVSIAYTASDELSEADIAAWLTYEISQFLKRSGSGFIAFGESK